MKKSELDQLTITSSATMLIALKQMDDINKRLLIVIEDNGKFKSVVSLGDIQRHLLRSQNFSTLISDIVREVVIVGKTNDDISTIKDLMIRHRIEYMPIVSETKEILKVIFWEDLFNEVQSKHKTNLDLPVIIMAGGKGTRLQPITHIIPKPLIPLGEKPIMQIIVEHFRSAGCTNFFFSVGYKANMLKAYFDDIPNKDYDITYYSETKPMGTAGSLSLIKDKITTPFFISNCDIIIEQDYSEIYEYHKTNGNELTAVAFIKNMQIPYGTFEVEEGGLLKSLVEKPEYTFMVNAGMYILEPHLLDEIPENKFFHITHLMEKIIARDGKVGVFPISEGSWHDIGQWKEYNKTLKKYNSEISL